MIPQYVYRGFATDQNDQQYYCGMCVPIGSDWSELSNTEKLAKMIIVKAQIAAENNAKHTVI
jgi:hypothetical protein